MTDDARSPHAAPGPDWDRIAREIAEGSETFTPVVATDDPHAADHAALLTALAATLRSPLPALPTPAETDRALTRVLARRDERASRAAAGRALHPARWAAAAAVLLLGGGLWWRDVARREHARVAPHRMAFAPAAATSPTEAVSLRLPDGSAVTLGPSTRVDTAVGFSTGRREIALRGAAFFDVTHDATHPFTVRTPMSVVRDVGTSFAVRTNAPDGLVVAVQSGAVSVWRAGDPPAGVVQLVAGDRAVLPARGRTRVERGAGAADDVAAARGRMILDAAPLPQVVESMRRWYGIELRVQGAALTRRRVTATFHGESGADAARIVAATLGATARIVGDTAWITPVVVPVL